MVSASSDFIFERHPLPNMCLTPFFTSACFLVTATKAVDGFKAGMNWFQSQVGMLGDMTAVADEVVAVGNASLSSFSAEIESRPTVSGPVVASVEGTDPGRPDCVLDHRQCVLPRIADDHKHNKDAIQGHYY